MGAVTPETCRVVLQRINICILLHLLDFYSHCGYEGNWLFQAGSGPWRVRDLPDVMTAPWCCGWTEDCPAQLLMQGLLLDSILVQEGVGVQTACKKLRDNETSVGCGWLSKNYIATEVFFLFIFLWENAAVLETGGGRSAVTRCESSEASMLRIVRSMSFLNIWRRHRVANG